MILLVSGAFAVAPAAYPLVSELSLPETGVVRVLLPPEVVGAEADSLGRTLRVERADGTEIPFAPLVSGTNPDPVTIVLEVHPTAPFTWLVSRAERPVDAVRLELTPPGGQPGAWVRVKTADWSGAPVFVGAEAIDGIPFPGATLDVGHRAGPFELQVESPGGPVTDLAVTGVVWAPERVSPRVELHPAGEPALTELGRARWRVPLGGPRRVRGVRVIADGDVFRREVWMGVPVDRALDGLDEAGFVRRLRVGEARVDQDRLAVDLAGDTLLVEIETDRGVPLSVTGFEIESDAAELVLRDAGPAPQHLYAGSFDEDLAHDLGYGAIELLRGAVAHAESPPPVANPGYIPLPTREGIDGPTGTLNLARFAWVRPVEAAPGWVRLLLDDTLRGHSRVDLGDVRVVDSEGRSVPYLIRMLEGETRREVDDAVREEVGGVSRIRIPLTAPAVPVGGLELHTPQGSFSRSVRVLRDRGAMTEPVRAVSWTSEATRSTLYLALNEAFGAELLVEIDNGPTPPLPVDRITLTGASWELRTRVPAGGARLVYGAPGQSRPEWDLALLEREVRRMPVATASLGAEAPNGGPSQSPVERAVVVASVGVLAVGLLGMAVRVVRTVPAADPPPTP